MYYHDIQFSFNWWFIIVPALALCSAVIGYANVFKRISSEPDTYVNEKFFAVVAGFFSAISVIGIFAESNRGIEQFFLNALNGIDDPALVAIIMPAVFVCLALLLFGLFETIMIKCQDGKYNRLDWKSTR